MWHSYRLRLFVGLFLMALLPIGLVALVASRSVTAQFGEFMAVSSQQEEQALANVIEYQLRQDGVESIGPFADEVGRVFGRVVTLSDEQGNLVVGREAIEEFEERLNVGDPIRAVPSLDLRLTGNELHVDSLSAANGPMSASQMVTTEISGGTMTTTIFSAATPAATFLNRTNLLLLSTAIATLLLAGLASWWLSRSFIRPVDALTEAAEGLARGNLSLRVPVERPDELGRLATSFNTMAGSLEAQERLRRQMVGDIAHELRTPLGNVRGYLEAVQDGVVPADDALIASLHEETMLLNHLIQDLQDLSLAEAGQLRLSIATEQAGDLLDAAARALRPQAEARNIAVTIDAPGDLPPVAADAERTGQILRNLLGNALTHTPPGGAVHLSAVAEDGGVVLRVADNGPGIDADHLPHIFDRFYRADASRDRATGNAGLGLAIARAYAEQQNGRVGVESVTGEGAMFWLWLPTA